MKEPIPHIIQAIADGGRVLVLDDGSSWLITPDDRMTLGLWKAGSHVGVAQSGHAEEIIENFDNGTSVRGVFAGQR